jgi:hypothetical protein
MQIYIYKNNQQMGPFEEQRVLEMLKKGELSANDMGVRQGEKDWQKLGSLFPNSGNVAAPAVAAAVNQPAAKKSRKGLLLGCGGFFLIGLLIASVLGFLAYRNLRPADSREDLPDTVGEFKLDNRYPPKGDIWGTKADFMGIYSNASKSKTMIYLMTVYGSEQAAKDALRSDLARSCKSGESPMNFSFADKSGTEISEGATCAAPLYIRKDNRVAAIGGSGADVETVVTFAENLPINAGAKMKKKENK